jgi:hypothetical protein
LYSFPDIGRKALIESEKRITKPIIDLSLATTQYNITKKFGEKCGKVFDVISCKCKILDCSEAKCDGCDPGAHVNCKCSEDKKIPELELVFARDQRRREQMGSR